MTPQRKKEIASHFMEALEREDLHTSEAAGFLNVNPCYISMLKTEKFWDSMSSAAWQRIEEWHESREKIRAFKIPEGEEIYKRAPKARSGDEVFVRPQKSQKTIKNNDQPEELSPEASHLISKKKPVKEHNGKSVILNINKGEIEYLKKRIDYIDSMVGILKELTAKQDQIIHDYGKEIFVIKEEDIAVLKRRIEDIETGMSHLVTIPKQEPKPAGIIIFQKNIYKP